MDLWRSYNCFTESVKSSYIDTFLDRSMNAWHLRPYFNHSTQYFPSSKYYTSTSRSHSSLFDTYSKSYI
ncbi:MAG: DUF3871 family protein [Bacteroidota bacterium]